MSRCVVDSTSSWTNWKPHWPCKARSSSQYQAKRQFLPHGRYNSSPLQRPTGYRCLLWESHDTHYYTVWVKCSFLMLNQAVHMATLVAYSLTVRPPSQQMPVPVMKTRTVTSLLEVESSASRYWHVTIHYMVIRTAVFWDTTLCISCGTLNDASSIETI